MNITNKVVAAFLILLEVSYPAINAYAQDSKADKKMSEFLYTKQCGDFIIVKNTDEISTELVPCENNGVIQTKPQEFRKKDKKKWYRTPKAETTLIPNAEILGLAKTGQDVADLVLLEAIKEKVRNRFDKAFKFASDEKEGALSELNQQIAEIDSEIKNTRDQSKIKLLNFKKKKVRNQSREVDDLKNAIESARNAVFERGSDKPRKQIRKFLALFPGIERDLISDDPAFKPLLCQYQSWKHKQMFWKKFGKILGKIGTYAGIAGVIAAATLSIPALPAVFFTISALKLASAGIKGRDAVVRMSENSAAFAAKRILDTQDELKYEIIKLNEEKDRMKNSNATSEELKLIEYRIATYEQSINEVDKWKSELQGAISNRKGMRKEVIEAITTTTIGLGSLGVGNFLDDKLKGFKSDKPDEVIPYSEPQPGDPQDPGDIMGDG